MNLRVKRVGRMTTLIVVATLLVVAGVLFAGYFLFKHPASEPSEQFRGIAYAHYGGLSHGENTVESIRASYQAGVEGVEIDVRLSKDGVPYLLHDTTLDRVTDETGEADERTFPELSKLHVYTTNADGKRVKRGRIPSLEQALQEIKASGKIGWLDIKPGRRTDTLAREVARLIKKHGLEKRVFAASASTALLYKVRQVHPQIVTALLLHQSHYPSRWKNEVYHASVDPFLARFLGVGLLLPNRGLVSREFVRKWHDRGISVLSWTPNTNSERAWLKQIGVGYATDDVFNEAPPNHTEFDHYDLYGEKAAYAKSRVG